MAFRMLSAQLLRTHISGVRVSQPRIIGGVGLGRHCSLLPSLTAGLKRYNTAVGTSDTSESTAAATAAAAAAAATAATARRIGVDPDLFRAQCLIDGGWLGAHGGATIPVTNPATGETLVRVPAMGASETAVAVAAAARAFPAWAAQTAAARSTTLRKWNDLILDNGDDLARIMVAEQGKPLAEAKGEVAYAASFVEWFAEEGKRAYGEVIPGHNTDSRLFTLRQPIGVTAAITPWNFPLAMITRKAAGPLPSYQSSPLFSAALLYINLSTRTSLEGGITIN